jgi:undecaprenyl diphosphate synthase
MSYNISPLTIPDHVAIIMDGNGRWANRQKLPVIAGHRAGAEALKRVCQKAQELKIKHLTVYAFSTENWYRPQSWVQDLMGLLKHYLKHEVHQLLENKIRFSVIGDRSLLSQDIRNLIQETEAKTANNTELHLIVALSYGSRNEITQATKAIAEKVQQNLISLEDITPSLIEQHLYTHPWPNPDLLIRTSGEHRISNFLLWQLAYAELVFVTKLWPDFTGDDLFEAIVEFNQRERRYGAVIGT